MTDHERRTLESCQRKLERIELAAGQLLKVLVLVWQRQEKIMATLDDVLAAVQEEGATLDGIAQKLAAEALPPSQQAKVDAVAAQVVANGQKLAALDASIPTPPPPVPATPPAA